MLPMVDAIGPVVGIGTNAAMLEEEVAAARVVEFEKTGVATLLELLLT